ncbi:CYFA0S16e00452g1_1 [Cyberlindnera fabianii]|uniref:CYFA0S16e00452g1_1 n=1 Tax=Cyberlindnera fabianii TaxID=36022 RepID=A0A061BAN9_CYBFA|nr:hypothetical protein BON22_1432 [Cyberlindnera fabianii]CDR44957.1 CYFA0S16e00452g1_1 [Cyberlindnera fabianii]
MVQEAAQRDSRGKRKGDKSPTRGEDKYRDRSTERVVRNRSSSSVEDNSKKAVKVDEEDVRGRATERDGQEADVADDGDDHQSIEEMNQQEMMMKLMGFGSFDSTKGKHVEGVGSGVAKKNKATKYRQYMNREKGFNRALSPDRKR